VGQPSSASSLLKVERLVLRRRWIRRVSGVLPQVSSSPFLV